MTHMRVGRRIVGINKTLCNLRLGMGGLVLSGKPTCLDCIQLSGQT